jgi:predicted RNase H-like HicB family nuclease
VARHSGEVRKPVSIALSTQFSTRFAVGPQFNQRPTMKKIIQVRIFKGENQYVAECLDLPVVTQSKTLDELTENLREAISLHLRGENLAELDLAEDPSVLASFELEPLVQAKA